jgi:hypothetical protein
MTEPKSGRPSQVTLAGWLVVGGSVVVVVTAFVRVAELRSLDSQQAIADFLASPTGDSLGLTLSGAQTILRIAAMVAASCAAASAILGWQVLHRSRGARVALSLLAVPLFVTGFVGSGYAAAFVTAAIVMLWFQPARDWFDGISRPAPEPRAAPSPPPPSPPRTSTTDRDPLLDLPPPTAPPLHPTPYAAGPAHGPVELARRPAAVTWACALAWLGSATVFVLMATLVLAILVDPGVVADARSQNPELTDSGMTDGFLRHGLYAMAGLAMAWSAAAAVLALLAWRRVRWAATALGISAGAAAGLCLFTLVGSLAFLLPLAVCAAGLALLLRPESRAWFRAQQAMVRDDLSR